MTTTDVKLLRIARATNNPRLKRRLAVSAHTIRQAGLLDTVKSVGNTLLDVQQFVNSAVGFVPVIGDIADGVNAMISALRGNFLEALLDLISAIPGGGSFVGVGGKMLNYLVKLSKSPGKMQKAAKFLVKHAPKIKKAITLFSEFVSANKQEILDYVEGFNHLGDGKVNPKAPDMIKSLAAKAANSEKVQELASKAAPKLSQAAKSLFSMVKESDNALKMLDSVAKPAAA